MPELVDQVVLRRCRVCGCTQNNACLPVCWWVADDLCSSCGPDVDDTYHDEEGWDINDYWGEDDDWACLACNRIDCDQLCLVDAAGTARHVDDVTLTKELL